MPTARFGDNERERRGEEEQKTADHRHMKEKAGGQQNQTDLDIADENIRNDLSDQHLERSRGHGQ